jgi:hypothetical protein
VDQPGGHTPIFTILIYLHILHKTLTDFEFIRLQNLIIFGLFMKCGSKYFLRSFDKGGHSKLILGNQSKISSLSYKLVYKRFSK